MRQAVKKHPELKGLFDFADFNPIQQSCLPLIM
jgi:hypothetical protein